MKKASHIFEAMRETLHSQEFLNICRIHTKAFLRKRSLTHCAIFLFILNLLNKSIPKELISFCEYCELSEVSRSAITQSRAKLSANAFTKLNDVLVKEFYTDNAFKTYKGMTLLVVDGSTIELPVNAPEILQKYGYSSNQTKIKVPMARISQLYDPLNGITWNALMAPYLSNEREIAIQHFEHIKSLGLESKILVIFDRGYPSLALIVYLLKNGFNFLIRSGSQFLKEVNEIVKTGETDTLIKISLKRATRAAKEDIKLQFPAQDFDEAIIIRIVVVTLNTGEKEVLITSLLDKERYPYKEFKELYFNRWGVEENYKFHKCSLKIENFSGKSCHAVEQDFQATILAANICSLLALEAVEELKSYENEIGCATATKYTYRINKNVSMEKIKNGFIAILIDPGADIEGYCSNVKNTMKRNLVPIRPGRSFKRKRKYPHRKYHMNQR